MAAAADLDLAFQLQLAEVIQASPESPDAAYALALHAADLARAAQDRSASSVRVAAHDAHFARELAAIPEAHHGDDIERPLHLDSSSARPRPLQGHGQQGRGGLAAAVCGPQGEVLLRVQKPVEEGFVGGREVLEAMALVEGLQAASRSSPITGRSTTMYSLPPSPSPRAMGPYYLLMCSTSHLL
jgi:hypothetical protein